MSLLVDSPDPVTLVGGGSVEATLLTRAVSLAPMVIAADSGINRAHALGQAVQHVIGDMDSVDMLPLDDDPVFHAIPEQMTTDLDKCLYSTAAPFYLGVGFLGGRIDHQLAAFHSMLRAPEQKLMLLGEDDLCFLAPLQLQLYLPTGTRISLFPMGGVTGKSNGLKYPINGISFSPDRMIGTSNTVMRGRVELEFDVRKMLVIAPVSLFEDIVEQLFQRIA